MIDTDYLDQIINSIQETYNLLKNLKEDEDKKKKKQLIELIESFSKEINKILSIKF
ncbi:MAG: hypothetical protein PHX15_01825 [Candidatus Nanoarchaeia archaeon]|nr:hypothetical protein [Candidatus Nanoarchaeia archaeon]MDD3993913.1 hypothetical protein [Candidatus Nanoarchaeia archaeon]MDD4563377.1 hypothetical protein [Candidatus Nanoarchaeia archaeon]